VIDDSITEDFAWTDGFVPDDFIFFNCDFICLAFVTETRARCITDQVLFVYTVICRQQNDVITEYNK